ncbi:MAG: hypothetical protein IPK01_16745 [Acidobacteria bacterium]|nr:hypothetical protein [Acidobacteriota bacterium]
MSRQDQLPADHRERCRIGAVDRGRGVVRALNRVLRRPSFVLRRRSFSCWSCCFIWRTNAGRRRPTIVNSSAGMPRCLSRAAGRMLILEVHELARLLNVGGDSLTDLLTAYIVAEDPRPAADPAGREPAADASREYRRSVV